ncbi:hypothetical protein [Pallidibacillus pasinlerensis]|uniref:Uncharacterized protein n=1 Tax=Pallidibacillus pasinlerensis TaxID=2703818 RepID=A0ABX0A3P5_9BACI|nr:hypothetical protein [Pallidibacillus pasinlerensis]NCU18064.1 hypothetical protein [Pallidibacillus pasinlerensis]
MKNRLKEPQDHDFSYIIYFLAIVFTIAWLIEPDSIIFILAITFLTIHLFSQSNKKK